MCKFIFSLQQPYEVDTNVTIPIAQMWKLKPGEETRRAQDHPGVKE